MIQPLSYCHQEGKDSKVCYWFQWLVIRSKKNVRLAIVQVWQWQEGERWLIYHKYRWKNQFQLPVDSLGSANSAVNGVASQLKAIHWVGKCPVRLRIITLYNWPLLLSWTTDFLHIMEDQSFPTNSSLVTRENDTLSRETARLFVGKWPWTSVEQFLLTRTS